MKSVQENSTSQYLRLQTPPNAPFLTAFLKYSWLLKMANVLNLVISGEHSSLTTLLFKPSANQNKVGSKGELKRLVSEDDLKHQGPAKYEDCFEP